MTYPWFDAYCLAKPGCCKDWKEEWEAFRYLVGGKMFVLRGEDGEGHPVVTLKVDPAWGAELRAQYPDITPGYYMNKLHWNSVRENGAVPDDILREMVDESYRLIFASLPKKLQREYLENP